MKLTEEDIRAYIDGEPITYEPRNSGGRDMKAIQNKTYPTMFHAVYPDGTPSADYYNYARAVNHSYVIAENERRDQFRMLSIDVLQLRGCV